jgi:hypothetical protein
MLCPKSYERNIVTNKELITINIALRSAHLMFSHRISQSQVGSSELLSPLSYPLPFELLYRHPSRQDIITFVPSITFLSNVDVFVVAPLIQILTQCHLHVTSVWLSLLSMLLD